MRKTLAHVGAAALIAGAVVAGPGVAFANEAGATAEAAEQAESSDASFGSVHIVQDAQYQGGAVEVAYEMSVPDSARSGDTVELTFQAPLEYDRSQSAELVDENGEVVAVGELTDAANRVITFTFTDYVDSRRDVTVSGAFQMIANDPSLADNPGAEPTHHTITFTQGGEEFTDELTILPSAYAPLTKVLNYGEWTGEDRGHDEPENAILWTANSPEGEWEGMTVSLEPENGSSDFVCDTLTFYELELPPGGLYHNIAYDNPDQRTQTGSAGELPPSVANVECSPEKVEVTYEGHIGDDFLRQFTIESSVTDRDEVGHFGTIVRATGITTSEGAADCPDPVIGGEYVDYAPACDLADSVWYNFVARDASSGGGEGTERDARISLEKYSTDEGLEAGDHDAAPGKALELGMTEAITFEIANEGNEPLTDLELVDTTLAGAELEMATCELEGVTLAPGETITCEGEILVERAGEYGDSATVTAFSVRDRTEVTATDEWWGTAEEEPVDPGESIDPGEAVDPDESVDPGEAVDPDASTDPGEAADPDESVDSGTGADPGEETPSVDPDDSGSSLLRTGGDVGLLYGGIAALLLVAAGTVALNLWRTRRS